MSNKTEPKKMDELLQAIKEGEISKDEIIKRLNSAIDREYQKKKGADMAFVAACENLLDKLLGGDKTPFVSHTDKYLSEIRRNTVVRTKPKARPMVRLAAVVVSVLVLVVLSDAAFHWNWFVGSPTADQQQYVIKGHQVDLSLISKCIAEHSPDSTSFSTTNWNEMVDYLGFEPEVFQDTEAIQMTKCNARVMSSEIQISVVYKELTTEKSIVFQSIFCTDINDAYMTYEQESGYKQEIADIGVLYVSNNHANSAYIWIKDNVVFSILGDIDDSLAEMMIRTIGGNKKQ